MQNSKFKIIIQNLKITDARKKPPQAAYRAPASCFLPCAVSGRRGFTIIELLVVSAIIALIASSVFVLLSQARAKGRDATREQHIKTIQSALESFYTNARRYPVCNPGEFITGQDCISVPLVNAEAIVASPRDPLNQGNYRYFYESAAGADYMITYYLETGEVPGKSAGRNQATP